MTDIMNDAETYGVEIIPAAVEAGQDYWQVVSIHHLAPDENRGRHHILLDAVNAANERVAGEMFVVSWDGGKDTIIIDGDTPEAAALYPMWKWQICAVEAQGAPSDQVVNLRTDHPDEAPGNSLFHHSFAITFRYTRAARTAEPEASSLSGRIPGGGGHTLALFDAAAEVKTQVIPADERYRFEHLPAGTYLMQDKNDWRVLGPVHLDGKHALKLDFASPPPQGRMLTTYLLLDAAANPETQLNLSLLADFLSARQVSFGFDIDAAVQAQQVYVIGDPSPETRATLTAADCEITVLPTNPGELLAAIQR